MFSVFSVVKRRFGLNRRGLWLQPDFLNFWTGQGISQVGAQVSFLALPLIAALTLDATPLQVGVLAAVGQAPMLLVGLFAGAWVDRRRRRPVMIATDIGRAAVIATIPIAAMFDLLTIEVLYAVAFISGVMTVFFDISYLSYIPWLVRREELIDANSKLNATASIAQVTGPGIGGLLIAALTAPFAMVLNALSFLGSAFFLARIGRDEPIPERQVDRPGIWSEIREGLRFVNREPTLRALVGCSAVTNLFG